MYKTINLPIKTSQLNTDYLFQCNKESARVWNECIRLSKELWKNEQQYSDRKYLQDRIKGDFSSIIPSKAMQITIKRYLSATYGIRKARKVGRTDLRYPYKEKKFFNTIWDSAMFRVDYKKNIVKLSKPIDRTNNKKQKPLELKLKQSIPKNIAQIELKYNHGLVLSITYQDDLIYQQIHSDNICGVDLGEIHAITAIDSNGNALIITGRKTRSYKRFRNKEFGKIQKKFCRCVKGSINYKKYRNSVSKLLNKTKNKIKNDIHKTSKLFINYLIENNIQTVVIGDLTKFNMNQKNTKSNGNKQRLIQWCHGQLINKINEKSKRHGIAIHIISEAYTSQTCPSCLSKHKPKSRNYVCSCGYKLHRDLVGSINILSKYIHGGKIERMDLNVKPLKYLRIA